MRKKLVSPKVGRPSCTLLTMAEKGREGGRPGPTVLAGMRRIAPNPLEGLHTPSKGPRTVWRLNMFLPSAEPHGRFYPGRGPPAGAECQAGPEKAAGPVRTGVGPCFKTKIAQHGGGFGRPGLRTAGSSELSLHRCALLNTARNLLCCRP